MLAITKQIRVLPHTIEINISSHGLLQLFEKGDAEGRLESAVDKQAQIHDGGDASEPQSPRNTDRPEPTDDHLAQEPNAKQQQEAEASNTPAQIITLPIDATLKRDGIGKRLVIAGPQAELIRSPARLIPESSLEAGYNFPYHSELES